MALGLFAQVGLIAHLFSLLVPSMGGQIAGLTMGLATACAMAGRIVVARLMPIGVDRRWVVSAGYLVQLLGSLVLMASSESQIGLIVLGVVLFGSGIGNATSLPPLVIQVEFVKEDVQRVVALVVAIGQATYAFAPLAFSVLIAGGGDTPQIGHDIYPFFLAVMVIQAAAIACFLAGRPRN